MNAAISTATPVAHHLEDRVEIVVVQVAQFDVAHAVNGIDGPRQA